MSLRRQVSPVRWELSLEEETLAGHMEATLERDRLNVWAAVGREVGAQPHPGRCQAQPLIILVLTEQSREHLEAFVVSSSRT